jgi:ubiquinol-cytochrome c reductase iron-sulfur subunit
MNTRWISIAFVVSALASLALAAVYVGGGQPQWEGILLAIALGGIGVGLIALAKAFLPHGPFTQERTVSFEPVRDAETTLVEGGEGLERRTFLKTAIAAAFGALGLAALFPIRSLGTRPGRELFSTAWARGMRLVTETGRLLRPEDLAVHGVLTVFPQGHEHDGDAQTLVIRLATTDPEPGPGGAAHEGLVAFSKVCTHAGCPVGLYQAETRQLFCPCHQSVFDVLDAAKPSSGPATRPLPQLPIGVDDEGYLIALDDYPEPIGPGYWDRGRA